MSHVPGMDASHVHGFLRSQAGVWPRSLTPRRAATPSPTPGPCSMHKKPEFCFSMFLRTLGATKAPRPIPPLFRSHSLRNMPREGIRDRWKFARKRPEEVRPNTIVSLLSLPLLGRELVLRLRRHSSWKHCLYHFPLSLSVISTT